uniref:Uncharacterized protein n=1 Tax=Caenorhabditis japonica TaxID=281687 RepID=A0A8R1EJQ9_CAEJA
MAELDQHRPTTSTYHRPTMEESVVKLKRLQRFTRQFSIFVHCEEEKGSKIVSCGKQQEDENNEDHLFKYPGNLRGIKRKRNLSTQSPTKNLSLKRRMMEHQKSIREEAEESPINSIKIKIAKEKEETTGNEPITTKS